MLKASDILARGFLALSTNAVRARPELPRPTEIWSAAVIIRFIHDGVSASLGIPNILRRCLRRGRMDFANMLDGLDPNEVNVERYRRLYFCGILNDRS